MSKKKFTCGDCLKSASVHSKLIEPPKPALPNRKSEGFPGFAHMDTTKVDSKPKDNVTIKKIISVIIPQINLSSTSTKPSSTLSKLSNNAKPAIAPTAPAKIDVKVEKKSPTPEIETPAIIDQNSSGETSPNKTISVRTDLIEPSTSQATAHTTEEKIKPENVDDHMDIDYDKRTVVTPHESIPDVRKWDIDEVYTYFLGKDTPEFAQILKEHQIDGDALLLIKREDVLDRFNLKLGAALRLYAHIVSLQYKNNNPILAWNEF